MLLAWAGGGCTARANSDDRDGFDIVFLQEAFHHLEPRAEAVIRLASLVRSGGRLVLQETNAWNPLIQARLLRGRGVEVVRMEREPLTGQIYAYGVERIITPGGLNRLFPAARIHHPHYVFYEWVATRPRGGDAAP